MSPERTKPRRRWGKPAHCELAIAGRLTEAGALRVHAAIQAVPGVVVARVLAAEGRVLVGYDPARASSDAFPVIVARLGWRARVVPAGFPEPRFPPVPERGCC